MAVRTVLSVDAKNGQIDIRNFDAGGNMIYADGWICIKLGDTKGNLIQLREMCVDVQQDDGTTLKKTVMFLCSAPY